MDWALVLAMMLDLMTSRDTVTSERGFSNLPLVTVAVWRSWLPGLNK